LLYFVEKQTFESKRMFVFSGRKLNSRSGATIVEVLVAGAIMIIMMLAMMTMQDNQLKGNNYLDFQLKRTQLQAELVGQVFNNANNCACLFAGSAAFSANPVAPGATLSTLPLQIGRFNFVNPGVCATATIPQPLVDNIGIDGMRATSIQLTNIMNANGAYTGEVVLDLQSTKPVLGPQNLPIRIKVDIVTSPAGAGNVNFASCAISAISNGASGKQGFCTPGVVWDNTNVMTCPVITGYSERKLTGIYAGSGTNFRSTSCCYIPNGPGSDGWCSPYIESWVSSFSGCGASTADYTVRALQGVINAAYDHSACCYIPNTLPNNAKTFSSPAFSADSGWSTCGGPYTMYDLIEQNVVTGGLGRSTSCTWVPK